LKKLLDYRRNIYSQNGEDGIIEAIFETIGIVKFTCCEFGAWDGVHLSNCKNLIDNGWSAVMIESDQLRYQDLIKTYYKNDRVKSVNVLVDNSQNSLQVILNKCDVAYDLDFLSVDIDGLDYEIFEGIDISPRLICIEVNAGHNPVSLNRIPREIAINNVGQSLAIFCEIAKGKGYKLIAYNGNAFFCSKAADPNNKLIELSPEEAYLQFLTSLPREQKYWLYRVNKGSVDPWFNFDNPLLTGNSLGFSFLEKIKLNASIFARKKKIVS
jgi:hypothetical protein